MKKKLLNYTVIFQKESEGGYTVTVPILPGCVSYGKNLNEARKMIKEAIELYIESLQEEKETIPTEGKVFSSVVQVDPSFSSYA